MPHYLILFIGVFILSACTPNDDVQRYSRSDIGQATMTEFATVLSAREVVVTGERGPYGAILGGGAGAVAGYGVGGGSGRSIFSIGFGLLGSVLGGAVEERITEETAYEYTVVNEDQQVKTIVQNINDGDVMLTEGTPVLVQISGNYQRVMPSGDLQQHVQRPQSIRFSDE